MATLMDFLTSQEVFIVVLIAISLCVVGTIYFVMERIYNKNKERKENELYNTTANKIIKIIDNKVVVESVVPEIPKVTAKESIVDNKEKVQDVVVNSVKEEIKPLKQEETMQPIIEKKQAVKQPIIEKEQSVNDNRLVIPIEEFKGSKEDINSVENILKEVSQEVEKNHIDKIEYTSIEPNQEEAKEEIRKATEELLRTQELQLKEAIDLSKFEEEQEENAIISMEELYNKSKELYEQNEITQYEDEGNEPISIADLEARMNKIKEDVDQIEIEELIVDSSQSERVKLDDFNTISNNDVYKDDKVFKSSPIISPIFGIEKQTNDMEFENTANYEKFDDEIKKTNEFLKVLKELQKKLE